MRALFDAVGCRYLFVLEGLFLPAVGAKGAQMVGGDPWCAANWKPFSWGSEQIGGPLAMGVPAYVSKNWQSCFAPDL